MCQVTKYDNSTKDGFPHPLDIPSRKWVHEIQNLENNLPESRGFIAITAFVDGFSRKMHLVPCKKRSQPWNMPESLFMMFFGYRVSKRSLVLIEIYIFGGNSCVPRLISQYITLVK